MRVCVRTFEEHLQAAVAVHGHLCAGQVLGVRMARRGCFELGIDPDEREDRKRLIVYVETDRCAADAVASVTGCKLGKRTLKHMDYGKVATTLVDTQTGNAVRVIARDDAREKATAYSDDDGNVPQAQLIAYQEMSDEELLIVQHVQVDIPPEDLPGRPLRRVMCDQCGESVSDGREVTVNGRTLCRACTGTSYYRALSHRRDAEGAEVP
jgi:formylmethanofuran dehydrogenase subunit E